MKYTILTKGPNKGRIRSVCRIPGCVERGALGGFVESYENLSQEGFCWVGYNARVSGKAKVHGNARIKDHAHVYGNATVSGNAQIIEQAQIFGSGNVYGDAIISGNAQVDNQVIFEGTWTDGGKSRPIKRCS